MISGAELGDHRLGIELLGTSSGVAVEDRVNLWPCKFGVIDQIGRQESQDNQSGLRSEEMQGHTLFVISIKI